MAAKLVADKRTQYPVQQCHTAAFIWIATSPNIPASAAPWGPDLGTQLDGQLSKDSCNKCRKKKKHFVKKVNMGNTQNTKREKKLINR